MILGDHTLNCVGYLELARKLHYTLITGDRVFGKNAAAVYPDIVSALY